MSYFIFDDVDTRDYEGLYVSFDSIDSVPKRIYDQIEIPARNGLMYIDTKRFENVDHVYHVIALTKEQANDLINALSSKKGYCRLSDGFNDDEHYDAVIVSVSDIKIEPKRERSTFKITFNRKPQRWLALGETAIDVESGDTVTNPTRFEASPLLAVKGYGNINIGGQEIDVENVPYGLIAIGKQYNFTIGTFTRTLDVSNVNNGDSIIVNCTYEATYAPSASKYSTRVLNVVGTNCNAMTSGAIKMFAEMNTATFIKGTSGTQTCSATYDVRVTNNTNHTTTTTSCTLSLTVSYNGNATLTLTASISPSTVSNTQRVYQGTLAEVMADSTKSALGNPMYIDLDIGECWNEDGGTPVSVNNAVALGSDLPKLLPGQTTFNYDNTITYFKVTPRWWKV